MWVWALGQEDPQEKKMATHSSILAWKTPRTVEPGGLQSKGSQRAVHSQVTKRQECPGTVEERAECQLITFKDILWYVKNF